MSNETRGTQPLPFDVPEQEAKRYTVQQIPGLRLWLVWDTVKREPQGHWSVGTSADAETVANLLNER